MKPCRLLLLLQLLVVSHLRILRFLRPELVKMNGKFGGIEGSDIGTYCTVMREGSEPGVMYGEGQGVITTKDGQGMATWTGQGIGRFTAPGKISFRGSVFYRTTSTGGGEISFLNNVVGVFEYEVDEQGNSSTKVWEWK